MELSPTSVLATTTPTAAQNITAASEISKYKSHNWAFLAAVLVTAISISIIIALLAKCQAVRRYLASYRHTRLREADTVSQCDPSGSDEQSEPHRPSNTLQADTVSDEPGLEVEFAMHRGRGINPHCAPAVSEEDDDGFIEDNYIPASERARAARAAENMEDTVDTVDTEEEMDEIEFNIA